MASTICKPAYLDKFTIPFSKKLMNIINPEGMSRDVWSSTIDQVDGKGTIRLHRKPSIGPLQGQSHAFLDSHNLRLCRITALCQVLASCKDNRTLLVSQDHTTTSSSILRKSPICIKLEHLFLRGSPTRHFLSFVAD
jgi:hypothetical protein